MGIAWIIGFAIYFYKRRRRKKLEAAGLLGPDEYKQKEPPRRIIIPPDPAIIEGYRLPGESAFRDGKEDKPEAAKGSESSGKIEPSGRPPLSQQQNTDNAIAVTEEITVPSNP